MLFLKGGGCRDAKCVRDSTIRVVHEVGKISDKLKVRVKCLRAWRLNRERRFVALMKA